MYLVYDYTIDELIAKDPVEKEKAREIGKEQSLLSYGHIIGVSVNPFRTAPEYLYYEGNEYEIKDKS